jgi:hypothetical protein
MPWAHNESVKVRILSFLTTSLDGYDTLSFPPGRFQSLGNPQSVAGRFVKDEFIVILPGVEI